MKQIRPSLAFMALLPSLAILFACSSGGNDDDYKYVAPSSSSVAAAPSSSSVPGTPSSSSGGGGLSSSSSDDTPVELAVTGGITLNFGNSHGVYFLGTENPYTGTYSITNAEAAGCGEISYFVREGSINEPGKYEVCARVTCAKTIVPDNILPGCKEAQVVADPSISSCAFAENENAVKKDAAPLPVPKVGSINSDYGRCVAEFSPYSSAAVKVFDVTANCKGYSATTSCGTFTVSLTDPPITHGFAFAGEFYKDGNDTTYSIGKTVDYSGLTIDNPGADKADCGSIVYAPSGFTKGSAAPSVTAATSIKVTATVECGINSSTPETWTYTINARIVPNPVLSCSWAVSPIKADEGNATPVVTVANNYGRCSAVSAATYSGGFVPGKIAAPTTVNTTATLACANLGTSAIIATCPALTVNPADRIVTGEVNFTAASKVFTFSGNQHYSIGATPGAEGNVAITNATAAGCGAVSYETSGTTAAANNEIKAIAYATCNGSKVELRSKTATVVANPSISACYWTVGADTVTSAYKSVSVTPKATISNSYDRCTDPVPNNSSYNPLIVSANVAAGAAKMVSTCTNATPASLSSDCPVLTALEGSAKAASAKGACDVSGNCEVKFKCDNNDAGACNLWSNASLATKLESTITNAAAAKCGDIVVKTTSGATGTGATGTVTVTAEITCGEVGEPNRGTFQLGSATATVVAAPTISACAWDPPSIVKGAAGSQYVIVDDVVSAKATVSNCFGRCTDGAQTTLVSTAAVKANAAPVDVNVTTTGTPGTALKATCSTALEIKSQPKCDAVNNLAAKTWSEICGGIGFYDVQWNVRPSTSTSAGCYWVKNLTGDWGADVAHRVNGTEFTNGNGTNRSAAATTKIDGGVYIYLAAKPTYVHNGNNATLDTGIPFCAGGPEPTLACALGDMSVVQGTPIDLSSKLTCSDGSAPNSAAWNGSGPNLTNPVAGTYSSLSAKAKCGGTLGVEKTASCTGTVKVTAAPTCDAYTETQGFKDGTDNKYCPGVAWGDVKFTAPTVTNNNPSKGCYFLESVGNLNMANGPSGCSYKLNGVCKSGAASGSSEGKKDGGVYLYIDNQTSWSESISAVASGSPFCADGEHKLICTAGTFAPSVQSSEVLKCRSGHPVAGLAQTGGTTVEWGSVAAGTYSNLAFSATCNGNSVSTTCTSPLVVATAVNVNIGYGSGNGATLDAGTLYNVTFTSTGGSGGVLMCDAAGAGTYGTINGVPLVLDGNKTMQFSAMGGVTNSSSNVPVVLTQTLKCYKNW